MSNKSNPAEPVVHRQLSTGAAFRFYLLGELRIVYAGEPISTPPYRTHSLLAALLLHPHPQPRARLIGLLFPDRPEHIGRKQLSHRLWLLRRSLPELVLETSVQEVYLSPEIRWLDVEAFRQAAARSDLAGWLEALALYRGDLLESIYDDWLLEEREALHLQHVRLLHRACAQLIRHRRFHEALPLAERLVQIEPCDEQALRALMHAYQAVGRRGAALAAYERFVSRAADELGIAPEPASQALAQAIRSAGPTPVPSPPPPVDGTPESLLRHAQESLIRGERTVVQDCLRRLHSLSPIQHQDAVRRLEIDLALYFEEHERAAHLLESCDFRTASTLVRRARLAQTQSRVAAARDAALEALALAAESGDRQSEQDALLVLAWAQGRLGQRVPAARSAEQALNLARACASPAGIAQALVVKGRGQHRQGRYTQALASFHEARSLAHEHGLRRHLAEALYGISIIQGEQGALLNALATGRQALSIWRDLGLERWEIRGLHNLASCYAYLGRVGDCLRILEQVQVLCERLGNPSCAAINQYHLADTLLYQDDALAAQAVAVAWEALAVFRDHNRPGWEAATLATLGRALWIMGQHDAALNALRQAYALFERLGELAFLPELLAGQGLAHLGLGQLAPALDCTRRALLALAQGEVADEAFPDVYYAHAAVLAAHGQERQAEAYFTQAYEHLLAAAAQLEDEPARQAFFHHNPITRRLMQEVYARGIAPEPGSGAITRQLPASRGGPPVSVTWTVDAGPADVALKQAQGAIALRRARLSRLLREARLQGATPTVAQLAEGLGVSTRTIQRDRAALRRAQALD